MTDTANTRYTATITHHSIASARIVPVGDTLRAAKINATREFGDEHGEYLILITDTSQPEYACERIAATRCVSDRRWW